MKVFSHVFLNAFGVALTIFLFSGCQERFPALVISSGDFTSLEEKIHELTKSDPPMKSLTVVVRASNRFIQFFHREQSVYFDFPVFTDQEKELEPKFRKTCAELGLTIRETTDPEGNRTLDASAGSDPAELARMARRFLEDLCDADEDSELEFTLMPLVK